MGLKTWWEERRFSSALEDRTGPSGEMIVRSGFLPAGSSLTQKALNQATVALGAVWVVLKRPGRLRGYRPDLLEESGNWNKSTGRKSLREKILSRGPLQLISALTRAVVNNALKNASGISVTSEYLEKDLQTREEITKDGRTPPLVTVRNVFPPEVAYVLETDGQNLPAVPLYQADPLPPELLGR